MNKLFYATALLYVLFAIISIMVVHGKPRCAFNHINNKNKCYRKHKRQCGEIVWDEPFYKTDCGTKHEGMVRDACIAHEASVRKFINIDELKVIKSKTVYRYDCSLKKFKNTGLCIDMRRSLKKCNYCRAETYSLHGKTDLLPDTETKQSTINLRIFCKNRKKFWAVTATTCDLEGNNLINCAFKRSKRNNLRRHLLVGSKYQSKGSC